MSCIYFFLSIILLLLFCHFTKLDSLIRWARRMHLGARFGLEDGRLNIPLSGVYYIYAQVQLLLSNSSFIQRKERGFQCKTVIVARWACEEMCFEPFLLHFMFLRIGNGNFNLFTTLVYSFITYAQFKYFYAQVETI